MLLEAALKEAAQSVCAFGVGDDELPGRAARHAAEPPVLTIEDLVGVENGVAGNRGDFDGFVLHHDGETARLGIGVEAFPHDGGLRGGAPPCIELGVMERQGRRSRCA